MPAKKSMPDARVSGIPSLEQGLKQGGGHHVGTPNKLTKIGDELNGGGKGKNKTIAINGIKDVKTDIYIPSEKAMKNKVKKQEAENVKINKKYRGED